MNDKIKEEFEKIFKDVDFTDEDIPEFVLKAQCYEGFEACWKSRDEEILQLTSRVAVAELEAENKKLRNILKEIITDHFSFTGTIFSATKLMRKAEIILKDGE